MTRLASILSMALFLTLSGALPAAAQAIAQDRSSGIIITYHRIGEDQYSSTSIRAEQFAAHVQELLQGGYKVVPLPHILSALAANEPVPPQTISITFDGGHKSAYEQGMSLLLKNNIPFTVFVATDHLDQDTGQYIGWDQVKKLVKSNLVTVGLHPASYIRLADQPDEEIRRQINKARARLREQTGLEPEIFSYPFGEYSLAYKADVASSGFKYAFGQQSGVAYAGNDMLEIPRFAMTESFGSLERFRMAVNALPFPISDREPKDPRLAAGQEPLIGFTADPALVPVLGRLSCFLSNQDKPNIQRIGDSRVEIRPVSQIDEERIRLNCTLPAPALDAGGEPRWRWMGMLLISPGSQEPGATEMPENGQSMTEERPEE